MRVMVTGERRRPLALAVVLRDLGKKTAAVVAMVAEAG